jgi:hypothetical protein
MGPFPICVCGGPKDQGSKNDGEREEKLGWIYLQNRRLMLSRSLGSSVTRSQFFPKKLMLAAMTTKGVVAGQHRIIGLSKVLARASKAT